MNTMAKVKYIRETTAAKAVSAYVIMKGSRHVATVQAHHVPNRCTVNVWQSSDSIARSLKIKRSELTADADKALRFQHASAGGYGYDKFASALAGLIIDGHVMADHAEESKKPPRGMEGWPHGSKAPRGYSFNNYIDGKGWTSCFKRAGLDYLRDLGYTVIDAI